MVTYFSQNAVIKAKVKPSGTYETVGAAQEVSIQMNFEDVKLYQFNDVKRAAAARHSLAIPVTVKFAKFDPTPRTGGEWFWRIINPDGFTNGKMSVPNTTNFTFFDITGEFTSSENANEKIVITAKDVYFKTFNWGGSLGEFIIENLEGEGADVEFSDTSVVDDAYYVVSPTGSITVNTGSTISITTNRTSTSLKYQVATSNTEGVTATIATNGTISAKGVKQGHYTIFASASGMTLTIPIYVRDP